MKYQIAVIGNGIAALCLLHELKMRSKGMNLSLVQLFSEEKAPSCSLRSTSHICLRGVAEDAPGVGATIYRSYQNAESFIHQHQPDGVTKARVYCFDPSPEQKDPAFLKRYGPGRPVEKIDEPHWKLRHALNAHVLEGYVFSPVKFLPWMEKKICESQSGFELVRIKSKVTNFMMSAGSGRLVLDSGALIETGQVVLCTGAYTRELGEALGTKTVEGSFLQFDAMNLGLESFVLDLKHYNLVYRHQEKQLILGATSDERSVQVKVVTELREMYRDCLALLGEDILPDFERAKIITGVRHKGLQRKPFWGKHHENVWGFHSLYKNGYSYAFLGGKELAEKILLELGPR